MPRTTTRHPPSSDGKPKRLVRGSAARVELPDPKLGGIPTVAVPIALPFLRPAARALGVRSMHVVPHLVCQPFDPVVEPLLLVSAESRDGPRHLPEVLLDAMRIHIDRPLICPVDLGTVGAIVHEHRHAVV